MGYHGNPLRQMIPQNITCLRKIPSVLLGGFPKFDLIALDRTLNPHSRTSWDLERTEGTSTFASFMQWYLQGLHNTKRWGWTKPMKKHDFIKINQDDIISISTTSLFCPFHLSHHKKTGGNGNDRNLENGFVFLQDPRPIRRSAVVWLVLSEETPGPRTCAFWLQGAGLYVESRFFVEVGSVVFCL